MAQSYVLPPDLVQYVSTVDTYWVAHRWVRAAPVLPGKGGVSATFGADCDLWGDWASRCFDGAVVSISLLVMAVLQKFNESGSFVITHHGRRVVGASSVLTSGASGLVALLPPSSCLPLCWRVLACDRESRLICARTARLTWSHELHILPRMGGPVGVRRGFAVAGLRTRDPRL